MTIKTCAIALLSVAALSVSASARDQIKIVGSSTVYPFTSYVAEEFKAVTGNPTPVVESTGTGGGMKLFCAGDGLDTPDFTNASRPIKADEFAICVKNGVTDITGMMVGFDGIAIAQSKSNGEFALTKEQLFLALADEVPGKDGKLMKNPYKTWNEIDAKLPNRKITVYGPPTTSGTRDSFDEMVMEAASKKFDAYGDKKGKYGGDYSAGQHRRPEGREQLGEGPDYGFKNPHHFLLFRRQNAQSRNIGPHGNETGMPQGEKTCEPIDEVERKRQDGVDENELGDVNLVVAKKKFRLPYRTAHQGHGQYAQDRAAVQAHQIFSSVRSPSRPVGL